MGLGVCRVDDIEVLSTPNAIPRRRVLHTVQRSACAYGRIVSGDASDSVNRSTPTHTQLCGEIRLKSLGKIRNVPYKSPTPTNKMFRPAVRQRYVYFTDGFLRRQNTK